MTGAHALPSEMGRRIADAWPTPAEWFRAAELAFASAADRHFLTVKAFNAWFDAIYDPAARAVLAAALAGAPQPEWLAGFGCLAFAGVIDGAGCAPKICLPCFASVEIDLGDGPEHGLECRDLILCDPHDAARWRCATGAAGILGWPPALDDRPLVRLHQRPLEWWRGGGSDVAGLGPARPRHCCVVDWAALMEDEAETLLGYCRILCDDETHADEIAQRRRAWRQARIGRIPRGGALYVAGRAGKDTADERR